MSFYAPSQWWLKFFPVPRMLLPAQAGVDISDRSIKAMVISSGPKGIKVSAHGEKMLPIGTIEAGIIKNREVLEKTLALLKEELSLSRVYASLPEDQAYIFRLSLPPMRRAEVRAAVELRLEEYVPLKPEDTIFDYEILTGAPQGEVAREVQVTALPRAVVAEYSAVFAAAGIIVEGFEIEAAALARAFIPRHSAETVMIADIGRIHTGFVIAAAGRVMFSSTIHNFGGEAITRNVARALKVPMEEAEQIKISQGLNRSANNKDLFFALIAVLSALKDEINRRYLYWQRDRDDRELFPYPIRRLVLVGGQSTLNGLTEYIGAHLDLPISVGDPWINTAYAGSLPPLDRANALRFGTALGLALRGALPFITYD